MQKLLEAPDKKRGHTCVKEKEGISFSFNSDQLSDNP